MPFLKPLAFGVLFVSAIVQYATKLAALQEAKHLGNGRRGDDKRLKAPEVTLHPVRSLDVLWGPSDDLPAGLRRTIRLHRAATGAMALSGIVAFAAIAFG